MKDAREKIATIVDDPSNKGDMLVCCSFFTSILADLGPEQPDQISNNLPSPDEYMDGCIQEEKEITTVEGNHEDD